MPVTSEVANGLVQLILGDLADLTYTIEVPTAEELVQGARWVLWVLDGPSPEAQEPGHFTTELIRAMCHADETNIKRLARVYPAVASAVHVYKNHPDGLAILRGLAVLLTP